MTVYSSPLRSSALASARYDDQLEELTLTFVSGRSYTYENVPEDIYEQLLQSSSPGTFYAFNIKDQY
jgi:KTSC domain